ARVGASSAWATAGSGAGGKGPSPYSVHPDGRLVSPAPCAGRSVAPLAQALRLRAQGPRLLFPAGLFQGVGQVLLGEERLGVGGAVNCLEAFQRALEQAHRPRDLHGGTTGLTEERAQVVLREQGQLMGRSKGGFGAAEQRFQQGRGPVPLASAVVQ